MKFSRIFALGLIAVALAMGGAAFAQYQTSNYMAPGGADWEVGGVLNIKTAGALKFNGTDKASILAASVANQAAGVASGYKIARGETALDGSNPTPVTTGLTAISACTLTIKSTSAPGVSTSVVSYGSSSGTMNMYGWKPTSNADPTLVASTGIDTIGWFCVGT